MYAGGVVIFVPHIDSRLKHVVKCNKMSQQRVSCAKKRQMAKHGAI